MSTLIYRIIYSIIAIVAAWLVKKFISDRLIDNYIKKLKLEEHTAKPIKKFFAVIVYIVVIFVLLGIWHLRGTFTGLLAGAGVAGIIIGLAIRDVVSDLLSGIMLFFDRPFKIGDSLVIGSVGGKVLDIGLRSVKLKTWDGVFATIPNRKVCSEVLKNYSKYKQRRFEIVIGVDYDSDLEKVRKAIAKALNRKDIPMLKDPAPTVALVGLDASSINFKILFWVGADAGMPSANLRGKLIQAIVQEFRAQEISLPFPQVTISSRGEAEPPKTL